MAFGPIHYVYLAEAVVMSVCVLLLIRRYLLQKNRMTLVFTLFIVSYALVGFLYFSRGFFEINSFESITTYRAAMSLTALTPALLGVFLFQPVIAEREGRAARSITSLLLVMWVLTSLCILLLWIGTVTHSFSSENLDVYSTTFGPVPYLVMLAIPITIALVDAAALIAMYLRESDLFYRTRVVFLIVGWLLILVAQIMLLGPATLVLSPLLSTLGVLLMATAILRRPPK